MFDGGGPVAAHLLMRLRRNILGVEQRRRKIDRWFAIPPVHRFGDVPRVMGILQIHLQVPRLVVGCPIEQGEGVGSNPSIEVSVVGQRRRKSSRPHPLLVAAHVVGNVLLCQAALVQERHVRILRNHVVAAHQDGRLVQAGVEDRVGKPPFFQSPSAINSPVKLRRVSRLIVAHVVFASRHDVISSLVAQTQVVLGQIVRGGGVVAPHSGAIVLLPGHQTGARRSANRRRTDGVSQPNPAIGELPQMRSAHRNIWVHLDPLRSLLIGEDEQYVGAFVRHSKL